MLRVGGITFEGERQRLSGYAELLPPLPDWTVTLSARHDDYNDVGGAFFHQVSSAYRLNRMITVGGSWDKGSRPPCTRRM